MTPPEERPAGKYVVRVNPRIADLMPMYLDNQRAAMARVEKELAAGNFRAIQTIGHDLKGSGGGYGFHDLTPLGAALEEAGRDGDEAAIREAVALVIDYLDNVTLVE